MKDKIYIIFLSMKDGWIMSYAVSKEMTVISNHCSSSLDWSYHDMGVTSTQKHDIYDKFYTNGWDIVLLEEKDEKTTK